MFYPPESHRALLNLNQVRQRHQPLLQLNLVPLLLKPSLLQTQHLRGPLVQPRLKRLPVHLLFLLKGLFLHQLLSRKCLPRHLLCLPRHLLCLPRHLLYLPRHLLYLPRQLLPLAPFRNLWRLLLLPLPAPLQQRLCPVLPPLPQPHP